jgi:hypothetical protein
LLDRAPSTLRPLRRSSSLQGLASN